MGALASAPSTSTTKKRQPSAKPYHGWKGKKTKRWLKEHSPDKWRVGSRFRRHIRTRGNPTGRIIKPYRCTYCPRMTGEKFESGYVIEIQGCHVDYTRPFAVLWLCQGCHRKMERGTLKWRVRDIHDYSSLVNARPERWLVAVPF